MIERVINFTGTVVLLAICWCIATLFFPLVVTGMLLTAVQTKYELDDLAILGFVLVAGIASIFTSAMIFSAVWNVVAPS